jgi:hypothetical protein
MKLLLGSLAVAVLVAVAPFAPTILGIRVG